MSAQQPTPPRPAGGAAAEPTVDAREAATVSADPAALARPGRLDDGGGQVYAAGELVADRYRIVRLLGRGGMGEVYEAHDRALDQPVALKTLPLDRAARADADRLDRELVLARRVAHPGACRLFDLGVDERGRRFVTMERLHGETLADHLARRGPLPPAEVAALLADVARALAAAHAAGVIHRDLKPHNIFLAEPEAAGAGAVAGGARRTVIMDFGLARRDGDDRASMTDFAGTPAYMAPEQLTSRTVTTAIDVYALGVVAFELLTGRLPFAGDTPIATAVSRLHQAPPPLREAGGPDDGGWDRLIQACLATDPTARPTAAELPGLIAAPPPPPPAARRRRRW
ncbi:MAG TPA: serine/threonine-protein kinase, partial [Kofleriaceae bacterium]|nr:serine/threonine-protein kinase [Kofleriaceae bacterium]